MDTHANIEHKFVLKGMKVGQTFLGCKKCWTKMIDGYAKHCSKCSIPGRPAPMNMFTITEHDKPLL